MGVLGWREVTEQSERSQFRKETFMTQLVNGSIECAECRREIRYADEFNCSYCGASLCDHCVLIHEDECFVSSGPES
jgi:hypothetical protein